MILTSIITTTLLGTLGVGNHGLAEIPAIVELDIKPGSFPNSINIKSMG